MKITRYIFTYFFIMFNLYSLADAREIVLGVFKNENEVLYTFSGEVTSQEQLGENLKLLANAGVFPEKHLKLIFDKNIRVDEISALLIFLIEHNVVKYHIVFDQVVTIKSSIKDFDPDAKIFLEESEILNFQLENDKHL